MENFAIREKLFTPDERIIIGNLKNQIISHLSSALGKNNRRFATAIGLALPNGPNEGVVLAGGAFASCLQKEPINDYDVYILNDNRHLYENLIGKNVGSYSKSDYIKNENILSIDKQGKVQYILTKFKSREEVIAHMDFKHCTISMTIQNLATGPERRLYITRDAYDCATKKILMLTRPDHPAEEWRTNKFRRRGYSISANMH